MPKPEPKKRKLHFETLDAVVAEVEELQNRGYQSHGNWDLAQTAVHLANWLRYPMDGFPVAPIYVRPIFWFMKVTVGPSLKKKILANGFSGGMPTAPESVPEKNQFNDAEGARKLLEIIDRAKNFDGHLHPSPLFGAMEKDVWIKVTLLHSEHHLGYLEPSVK
ncbi:MAG: DUF1569 domain-containing protein [Planctomycetota bacterium]